MFHNFNKHLPSKARKGKNSIIIKELNSKVTKPSIIVRKKENNEYFWMVNIHILQTKVNKIK